MKYTVKVNKVRKNEGNLRGFATVVFGESFKVTNIAILENSEGNLFVSMPRYRRSEVDEKNNYIYIRFPVEMNIGNRDIEVVGRVILSLESPNRKDCYDNRIQFKGISHELRETVVKYIFEQQRIIQRKERGEHFGKENTGN